MSFDCKVAGVYAMAEDAKKEKKDDGKKAKGADAEPKTADAADGSKKKKMIIIGAIAGVVLVGGGIGGFMMFSGGGESKDPAVSGEHGAVPASGEHGADPAAAPAAADEHGAAPAGEHGAAAPAAKTEVKSGDTEPEIGFGESYAFKTFHLNLGNPLENHYIRLEIAAEYKGGDKQKAEIERRLPQLRDAVVSVVSSKSREFLLGPDGKAQLRREVLIKLNRYMTTPIESVFITDLLIE